MITRILPLTGALLLGITPLVAQDWPVNSLDRPRPPVVGPGPERPPAPPPEDAIVLLPPSASMGAWLSQDSTTPKWIARDGYLEVVPGTGAIHTRAEFGSVQLHLEWASPNPPEGTGQDRGNSGVFLMSRYEIQVLDSWGNDTYADGQAAAMYGQSPPLVNASRPPGQWQSYDIVFIRPLFGPDGSVTRPARVTVFHNGILVHLDEAFTGSTVHGRAASYQAHPDRSPLLLQEHGHPVRFRNIWIRELPD